MWRYYGVFQADSQAVPSSITKLLKKVDLSCPKMI